MDKPLSCRHPGCNRDASTKGRGRLGFCNAHYLRYRRGQDMNPSVGASPVQPDGKCKYPGCDRSARRSDNGRNGFCSLHNRRYKRGQDMGAPMYMAVAGCKVPGCDGKHAAKGFCGAHYIRWATGKPLEAPVRKRMAPKRRAEQEACTFGDCDRPRMAKGLCSLHYYRKKKGVPLDLGYRPKHGPVCKISGCGKPSDTLGYCGMHYSRHLKGQAMHPGKLPRRAANRLPTGTVRPSGRGGKGGYLRVKVAEPDIWMDQHRHIMAQHLDRSLTEGENVHHINGSRSDNRIENLELWSGSQPSGQRVSDKVEWALDFLRTYAPDRLK